MKKVIHIIPALELGGVQSGILYSIKELNAVYDYKVLVLHGKKSDSTNSLPNDIEPYFVWTESPTLTTGWLRAYRILKQIQPDIIISSLWKSVFISCLYKIFHSSTKLLAFYHSTRSAHAVDGLFLTLISFFQDRALADSTITKEYIQKKYRIKNVSVIFYHFPFTYPVRKEMKKISLPVKMAYFGRVTIDKGITRSIEFCKLCKLNGIQFFFHIYGDGDLSFFKKKITELGLEQEVIIKEPLPVDQVVSVMHRYDFLLQLSNYEGMALSVVEAMNCGLVPIVTPVGEIKNYSEDGKNAIWLDKNFEKNLPDLVEKLKKAINNPEWYHQLSVAGPHSFSHTKKYTESLIEAINIVE